ncbi:MAG: class I SAM-dependent methyltransferase [Candidatus Hydrogenedentes bacterium]|nr:class I SAM-dependent methyltransferase [Candidatus Hydrogenedentota bacterium]
MTISMYGEAFSAIYNRRWGLWGRMMWPLIAAHVPAAGLRRPQWLDLCCGGGTLLRLAAEHGYEVTGVDQSPFQLAHARLAAPAAQLVEGDILRLNLGREFDVVTCVFDSLNYVLTARALNAVLQRVRRHLRAGGTFIFDLKTPAGFSGETSSVYEYGEGRVQFDCAYDARKKLYQLQVRGTVQRDGTSCSFEERHLQRAHSERVIAGALARNGFQFRTFDAETQGPVHADARRVVYVARLGRHPQA